MFNNQKKNVETPTPSPSISKAVHIYIYMTYNIWLGTHVLNEYQHILFRALSRAIKPTSWPDESWFMIPPTPPRNEISLLPKGRDEKERERGGGRERHIVGGSLASKVSIGYLINAMPCSPSTREMPPGSQERIHNFSICIYIYIYKIDKVDMEWVSKHHEHTSLSHSQNHSPFYFSHSCSRGLESRKRTYLTQQLLSLTIAT